MATLDAAEELRSIEQSIQALLEGFVFSPNDAATWASITDSISAYLSRLWEQRRLMGETASDAFTVACGLGSTMTAQDIIDGNMIVQVTLQLIRPGEHTDLSFTQAMSAGS